jgi:Protein of unknown function (DUF2789)
MELAHHTLPQLFAQLGLPDDTAAIEAFIAQHAPLRQTVSLTEAPFWSPSQAAFLRSELAQDADWAELVDTLDVLLRRRPVSSVLSSRR